VVAEGAAKVVVSKRTQKSVVDIGEAIQDVHLASKIFTFIKVNHHLVKQGSGVRVSSAEKHLVSCETIESELYLQLEASRDEEAKRQEERARQEFEHSSRLRVKQEEQQRVAEAAENEKKEKQLLAVQKDRQLQELREKWVSTTAPPVSSSVGSTKSRPSQSGGSKRKKKNRKDDENEVDSGGVFEEGDGFDKVDRSTYQGEINFGSSSDEQSEDDEPSTATKATSQLDVDLFGDDEDDDSTSLKVQKAGKRKVMSQDDDAPRQKTKRLKKHAISSDGEESENDELDEQEPTAPPSISAVKSNSMLIASDDEE